MPMRNPFRRQDDAPTLRDRAADLSARLASAIRRPAPSPATAPKEEPVATADPIFAAIEEHAAAREAFAATINATDRAWLREQGLDTSDAAMAPALAAWDAANGREIEAWNALFEVRPTTMPGVLALIRYAQKWAPENDGVAGTIYLREVFGAIADSLSKIAAATETSNALIRDILAGWAAWGPKVNEVNDSAEGVAAWGQNDANRDRLIHAAMALPATRESIAPKALACAWMEWVSAERPGQPRDAYGPADQLVYDIHATIMGQGIEATELAAEEAETRVTSGASTAPSDLADACLWAVQRRAWIDHELAGENDWSDDRFDAESGKVNAVFTRAIEEPSTNLREIMAKAALALEDFERFKVYSFPGQEIDDGDRIVQIVLREVAAFAVEEPSPNPSAIDFGPDAHIAELAAEFCRAFARNAVTDRAAMAGAISEEEWLPHYNATAALLKKLEATRPKTLLGMALKCLGPIGAAAWDIPKDGDMEGLDRPHRLAEQFEAALMADALAPFTMMGPDLLGLIDLSSATLQELRSVYETADELGTAAHAQAWMGRCKVRGSDWDLNPAGHLAQRIGDALIDVVSAAISEAKSRVPTTDDDRRIRLEILARSIFQNDDPAGEAAFAREILASVEH